MCHMARRRSVTGNKALAELSDAPTLFDPTMFDRLAAHVGRCSCNIFCSIKRWIEFAHDQALRQTILLDATILQCFAAVPKLCLIRAICKPRLLL